MKNFRNLIIWDKGMKIVNSVYNLALNLPKDEHFSIRSQITRAAVSIPSNIAEGCSRNSEKDFKRFLEIALGSNFELETQFLIIKNLNFINEELLKDFFIILHEEQRMINGYISKINKN